ncbi:hypothetical protein [Marinoscillum furvescens]|uniref:Uncharacterized protein n=1 Tax=Marinoscillum furvescens DSM 4134 TaxID=1122208 RepID=A0A3D9KY59_MARFU|nr:hypothetical protein [Marinoscillum furvescens]RED94361.1 hypothetical protein C7460_12148 [Marinoscillum furvescens DSM 4134]
MLIAGFLPQEPATTHYTGVYQGKSLFVQNPFDRESNSFCISAISINGKPQPYNYRLSAIKLDFDGVSKNSPVNIKITHREGCTPIIINRDAITYHTTFSFQEISVTDSVLVWQTRGERANSTYVLEHYEGGIWLEQDTIQAEGTFGGAMYVHFPEIQEGANKLRLKYIFPGGNYLYSREIDFHHYPEPVTFKPFVAERELILSRSARYEVFDAGGDLVLTGKGATVDVSNLPRGEYVIYFNNTDPGAFTKK